MKKVKDFIKQIKIAWLSNNSLYKNFYKCFNLNDNTIILYFFFICI